MASTIKEFREAISAFPSDLSFAKLATRWVSGRSVAGAPDKSVCLEPSSVLVSRPYGRATTPRAQTALPEAAPFLHCLYASGSADAECLSALIYIESIQFL